MEEIVKIDQKIRRPSGRQVSQEFSNLELSSDASLSFSLGAQGYATVLATLENANNLRLFGTNHFSFFQDSVSDDNLILGGANVDDDQFILIFWYDLDESDGNNITFKAFIYNNSGSSADILVRENFRFLVEEASEDII